MSEQTSGAHAGPHPGHQAVHPPHHVVTVDPIEQVDVTRELIAHCEDALASGTEPERIEAFDDATDRPIEVGDVGEVLCLPRTPGFGLVATDEVRGGGDRLVGLMEADEEEERRIRRSRFEPRDRLGLDVVDTTLDELVARDPDPHGEPGADLAADRLDHLADKA